MSASASIIGGLYATTTEEGPCFETSEEEAEGSGVVGASEAEVISSAGANVAGELAFGLGEEGAEEKGDLTAPPHYQGGQLVRKGSRLLAFLTCDMNERTTRVSLIANHLVSYEDLPLARGIFASSICKVNDQCTRRYVRSLSCWSIFLPLFLSWILTIVDDDLECTCSCDFAFERELFGDLMLLNCRIAAYSRDGRSSPRRYDDAFVTCAETVVDTICSSAKS